MQFGNEDRLSRLIVGHALEQRAIFKDRLVHGKGQDLVETDQTNPRHDDGRDQKVGEKGEKHGGGGQSAELGDDGEGIVVASDDLAAKEPARWRQEHGRRHDQRGQRHERDDAPDAAAAVPPALHCRLVRPGVRQGSSGPASCRDAPHAEPSRDTQQDRQHDDRRPWQGRNRLSRGAHPATSGVRWE